MYLEIKFRNYFMPLLAIVFISNPNLVIAQDIKDVPINLVKPEYIKSDKLDVKKYDEYTSKKQYSLLKDSFVYRVNDVSNLRNPFNNLNLSRVINDRNVVGKYLFAYTKSELPAVLEAHAARTPVESKIKKSKPVLIDKFRVILDKNNRVYFTDGSFLIKFNSPTNFSNFASIHNLMLKKEYIDLNMGLYTHSDFNSLEDKINFLKNINTISSVRYNVINPYIQAE